jgi:small subunit ribosomal protein S1
MAELKKPESEESEKTEETMSEMLDYERTFIVFDDGDIVKGKVVRIDRDEVLVDIGYKSEGAIPLNELCIRSNAKPEEIVSIGDDIEALVLQKEDKDGRLILSKKRAEYERAWQKIEEINEKEGIVEGEVIEVVKGGLILDVGLRAFLPASLVEFHRVKELDKYIGQKLECKIIEMDRNRKNVVVSRRAILEGKRREDRKEILSKLEKGQILTGKISSLADFGAFVDLGELDGLIHISELSWNKISHPSEVVAIGDEVKVQVLDIEEERGRISLGLRQTQEDPWKEAVGKHKIGEVLEGTVERLVPFGAFVRLSDSLEGLVHISELSDEHIGSPEAVVKVGDKIKVKLVDINLERRRVSLSLKQAEPPKAKKPEVKAKESAEKVEAEEKEKVKKAEAKEKPEAKAKPKAGKAEAKEKVKEKKVTVKVEEKEEAGEEVPVEEAVEKETILVEVTEKEPAEAEELAVEEEKAIESTKKKKEVAEEPVEPAIEEPAEPEQAPEKPEPEPAMEEPVEQVPEPEPEEVEAEAPKITVLRELKSSKEFESGGEKEAASEKKGKTEPSSLEEILADMRSSRSHKTDEESE